MLSSVLIAYATRGGSTREVAHAIGAALDEAGVPAEVLPVEQVNTLTGREAVILGSPLYIGRFPKPFHRFLRLHHDALHHMRPWLFIVGPTKNRPEDFDGSRKQAERQLAEYSWLNPKDMHIFGGRWNMETLPFPFSWLMKIPGNPVRNVPGADIRDWQAIREWGITLARQIRPDTGELLRRVG